MSALHEMALAYAKEGIPVFPCEENGKRPVTKNGFHDATTDLETINTWWKENPNYNLAFSPEEAGLFVVDIDPGVDNDILEKLPNTYRVRTPRGGYHFYYKGSGKTTASKIAPHVDTRGEGGYVLTPPSKINGIEYEVEQKTDYSLIPEWILKRLAVTNTAIKAAVKEEDLSANIERARKVLQKYVDTGDVAIEGQGGDARTFRLCCEMLDLGLSIETAQNLIEEIWNPHCEPSWDLDGLKTKLNNAACYQRNEAGAYAVGTSQDVFGEAVRKLSEGKPDELAKQFQWRYPDEDENLPSPEYWDEEKTMPKGATVVVYGEPGCMKSTLMITDALNAANKGAVAIIAVGEGAYGVRTSRIPAACRERGISTKSLREKLYVCPAVPNLSSESEIEAFIKMYRPLNPSIVIIDTLATAAVGVDENSDAIGKLLTSNGAVGKIKRALGDPSVILIHHTGKDETRGARGHSSIRGNADAMWKITADKEARTITKKIEKMRDGEELFSVEYKVTPPAQVPVARKIGRVAYSAPVTEDLRGMVEAALERARIVNEADAIATPGLARLMLELEFPELRGEGGKALTIGQDKRQAAIEKQLKRAAVEQRNKFAHLTKKLGSAKNSPWMWSLPYHDERL